ncbi:hypothetical protein CPB85DRAFT_1255178 [Mucidula mucida]|nr:hypothetical protein CPB85DRAFT_1255178 [Mucidula mucida]
MRIFGPELRQPQTATAANRNDYNFKRVDHDSPSKKQHTCWTTAEDDIGHAEIAVKDSLYIVEPFMSHIRVCTESSAITTSLEASMFDSPLVRFKGLISYRFGPAPGRAVTTPYSKSAASDGKNAECMPRKRKRTTGNVDESNSGRHSVDFQCPFQAQPTFLGTSEAYGNIMGTIRYTVLFKRN